MATLLDLFIGSPQDLEVKPDTETFIEQETTGLRVKSAVELNNPLIYGNDAGRIILRSTPSVELMKEARAPEGASSSTNGLLGQGLSKLTGGKINSVSGVRNKINDLLGIPEPNIPTRVWNEIDANNQLSVQDVLDQKNGTEFGKFLKQTGGGNPKTIANQAIGNAIELGKDKLRDTLFGKPLTINQLSGQTDNNITDYKFDNTFSTVTTELYNEYGTDLANQYYDVKKIDLQKISPVYGIDRESGVDSNYISSKGIGYVDRNTVKNNKWNSTTRYNRYNKFSQFYVNDNLENKYGLKNDSDLLNLVDSTSTTGQTTEELEGLDLIPFWIGKLGSSTKTHFRTILNGITETVTPSWNSNNFFGNPFSFRTYSSIDRNVSFSLKIYCSSEVELLRNWERINLLTQYAYPKINSHEGNRYADPPIIDFRLGDIYNKKIGYIESLSYTYPDEGSWEIDPLIGLLPKYIDVSISIGFIETDSITDYYDYERSDLAKQQSKEDDSSNSFSGESRANSTDINSAAVGSSKTAISINNNKSESPNESQNKTEPSTNTQAKIPNLDPNKTTEQSISDAESSMNISRSQALIWVTSLKVKGYTQEKNVAIYDTNPKDVVFSHPSHGTIIVSADGNIRVTTSKERNLNTKFPV